MMENWNDGKKLPSEALEEANVATLKKICFSDKYRRTGIYTTLRENNP